MRRGRDQAGNVWEYDSLDANGKPVNPRLVQAAQSTAPTGLPGALGVVPPNPAMVAKAQREQSRQDAADQRAQDSAGREAATWNASHNPDGSPKVQAPSLLGDSTKTGPAYMASLPQNIRARVQQLLDGRSMLTAREKGQPLGQQIMDAANQADPNFDENVSHARYVERTQYTGMGKGALLVQAADRLSQHINDLYAASNKLPGPNLGFTALSNLATATANQFHQKDVATYNVTLPLIAGELQKLTKNGVATVDESKHIMASLSPNQPRDVRNAAIKEIVQLGRAQFQPLRDSWASAWQGSTPPPMPMDFNPATTAIFDAIENDQPALTRDKKGALVVPGIPGADSSAGPPLIKPGGPTGGAPGSLAPRADYSGMVGGPGQSLAVTDPDSKLGAFKQTYRTAYDPVGAAALATFIRHGTPYETAAAYAQSHGFEPPPEADYAAAVAYHKTNPNSAPNVEADRMVPTTFGERVASSPGAALVAGAGAGATAGLADVVGRSLAGPGWDANRQALAQANPNADIAGNVIGGAAGMAGGEALLSRFAPGALALGSRVLGRAAPLAGDAAYGATYGASENPDNPGMGALTGAIVGAGAGYGGRKVAGGLANVIAPPEGAFGPAYAQGVFPTIGQRFKNSGFVGRAVNTAEQAMQSFPGVGAMVARARDIPRDAAQLGAFNEGLGELAPFDKVLNETISILPPGTAPGTAPHVFTQQAFKKAYDTARAGMQFVPDDQYAADLKVWTNRLTDGTLSQDQAKQVLKRASSAVTARLNLTGGYLPGDAYKLASSELGDTASTWAKDGSTVPMAKALGEFNTIFDEAARRNSDPAAVSLLEAADRGWAKYAVVRNAGARVGGDPGTFTMKALDRAVQQEGGGVKSGPYQRGTAQMQDYATAVQPLGDTLSNSGTGERLLTNRMFMGEQGVAGAAGVHYGLGGAALAHPGALAPFAAYAPGINALVTRAIAPRSATLPPDIAAALDRVAAEIKDRRGVFGRLAVPGALGMELSQ